MYIDELDEIHPNVLQRYYGVEGGEVERNIGTGAGSSGPDFNELEDLIEEDQNHNIRHEAIEPASSNSPFESHADENHFRQMLDEMEQTGYVPGEFGLRQDEWIEGQYPSVEVLKMRRGKVLELFMPFEIWWLRAVRWSRALELLTMLQVEQNI